MKKIFIFCFAITINGAAQTANQPLGTQVTPVTPGFEAPVIVTDKFSAEYPNSNPSWRKTGDNYAAEYLDGSTQLKRVVIFDNYGNKISTDNELANGKYPEKINAYLKKNYQDTKFQLWYREVNGKPSYYTLHNSDTLRFNTEGSMISKKPEDGKAKK